MTAFDLEEQSCVFWSLKQKMQRWADCFLFRKTKLVLSDLQNSMHIKTVIGMLLSFTTAAGINWWLYVNSPLICDWLSAVVPRKYTRSSQHLEPSVEGLARERCTLSSVTDTVPKATCWGLDKHLNKSPNVEIKWCFVVCDRNTGLTSTEAAACRWCCPQNKRILRKSRKGKEWSW
jgi:hypothetical protein